MYWKGTLILCLYTQSWQWVGIHITNIFSNRIITDLNKDIPDDRKIQANQATQILGMLGHSAVFFSVPFVQRFGRKCINLTGAACLTVSNFLISLFIVH